MENINTYLDYEDRINLDATTLVVALWNKLREEKIFPNKEKFFKEEFGDQPFDVAWAVSAGNYRWTDEFVYRDSEGHLMSFSRLDDKTCPIDMKRIAIGNLIQELQEIQSLQKAEDNIPDISKAIQDALQDI